MNQAAEASLVERVDRVARSIQRRYGMELDARDVVSEGYLGLAESGVRHRAERGTELWTYAFARVRGRMIEHVARQVRYQRLVPPQISYDEGAWEAEGESHLGVVSPGLCGCDALGQANSSRSIESCMAQRQLVVLMGRLLREMPAEHRSLLTDVYIRQITLRRAAECRGMAVWRVKSLLKRAVRDLRKRLSTQGYRVQDLFGK